MIPFRPLTPADFARCRPYFDHQPWELCAYSLASIIAWSNEEIQPYGAEIDDALIIAAEFDTTPRHRHLLLPVSPARIFAPDELADLARQADFNQFWFVPQDYIDRVGQEAVEQHFSIAAHGAYDDYVYRVLDLAELAGNRYSKKRNLIKQFIRNYVDAGRVQISPIGPADTGDCLDFLERWCQERNCDAEDQVDLACEKEAAINSLNHLAQLELSGICLRIDGQVSAFGIRGHLTDTMATLQYEKAFGSIKGLYQYFDQACARMLFEGYTHINKESDMGIPGLAKAKRSYHPVKMVPAVKLILN